MNPYVRLFTALLISFVAMFAIMYSRVNLWNNVFLSLTGVYMAGLMVAAMLITMLRVMRTMYANKLLNRVLIVLGIALIALFWTLLRTQAGIGNEQFLRSMISHHASAILVCEKAQLTDPRIEDLCDDIVTTQAQEIEEMKDLLQD